MSPAKFTVAEGNNSSHVAYFWGTMQRNVLHQLQELKRQGKKALAMLLDPDKLSPASAAEVARKAEAAGVRFLLVGGSLMVSGDMPAVLQALKDHCSLPVVIFPGSMLQVHPEADALLFLSLISGRNPELLIGHHVMAAPAVRRSGLEVLATGYLLIESGRRTTAHYMSQSDPIPRDKPEIALATALAGEMLGLQLMYVDAGSGAAQRVPNEMISLLSSHLNVPLIVGGGIRDAEDAHAALTAGADMIVVGNALEADPSLLEELAAVVAAC